MDLSRTIIHVEDTRDERIRVFRGLKDRELARKGGRFIAEGEHVVRRLLASRFQTESVLLSQRRADELSKIVPADVPIYIASTEVMNQLIGFKFHSGVLACGLRGPRRALNELFPNDASKERQDYFRIAICEEINNAENLGSIIRVAAGFGADALLLGERCIDPFFRQCIRVSMGTVFRLPLIQSENLLADLNRLHEQWNVELIATVLAADGQPLATAPLSSRMGILFGGEAQGLSEGAIAACHRRITIPMHLGTDSLNVAVAAGIVLYHFWGRGVR